MEDNELERVALSELKWPEIEATLEAGTDTIILPLGATEQHGPHLPLDTDTRLAAALAKRIAHRLGETLVAPTVPVGPSEEHTGFPGTISISPDTLTDLLRDYVSSFGAQGFERVVLLPGHGGWFPVVEAAYPELSQAEGIEVVAVTRLQRYLDLLQEGLTTAGINVNEPVVHAGASETSILLAIDPSLVDDQLPEGHTGTVSAANLFTEGIGAYDENGVLGDARPATADAGEIILEHVAIAYTEYIREEFRELDINNSEKNL
ncbi:MULTISPECIES: creatininase family protein [Halolamina]|uniref:creatininase family protein n=1 Tax=Halolamina TaxID=1075397 RepID=UPI000944A77B|nr:MULTISPECIES: creatininase family protein [Halolamina]NHX37493.1 creatininase family protein [Halolamina sp. R1-12]